MTSTTPAHAGVALYSPSRRPPVAHLRRAIALVMLPYPTVTVSCASLTVGYTIFDGHAVIIDKTYLILIVGYIIPEGHTVNHR